MSLANRIKNYFIKELEIEKKTKEFEIGFEELKQIPKDKFYESHLLSYGNALAYHAELSLRDLGRVLELSANNSKKTQFATRIIQANNQTENLVEKYQKIFENYKKNTGFKNREKSEWEPKCRHFHEYNGSRHAFWNISREEYVESAIYLYKNLKFRYEFMMNKNDFQKLP